MELFKHPEIAKLAQGDRIIPIRINQIIERLNQLVDNGIPDNSISTSKIQNLAVTNDKILSVDYTKITNAPSVSLYTEVNTYADLPNPALFPDVNYIVLTSTGNWYTFDKKDAGLYHSDGISWTYLNAVQSYFTDSEFRIQDEGNATKQLQFDVGTNVANSTTVVLTVQGTSGTIAYLSNITGTNSNTNTGDETTVRINALYGFSITNPNLKEDSITSGTTSQYWRGDKTFQTLNTLVVTENTNLYYTDVRSRASISKTITGIDYDNTTGILSLTSGYVIPTTTEESNWNTAYTNRITSLTTIGSSGASTLSSNTLNVPTYTLSGLGGTTLAAVNAQNLSLFAATTSAQLAGVISDETGSGLLVFATSPTFTTQITTPLIYGSVASGGDLTLGSTSHGTKGNILFGNSRYNEVNDKLAIGGNVAPTYAIQVESLGSASGGGFIAGFGTITGSPVVGNLCTLSVQKQGVDIFMLGINKNTTTGSVPANGCFISSYNNGSISIGRGNGTGLPSAVDVFVSTAGLVGIGVNAPTARLNLPAGQTSANSAPLKFTSGSLQTTAEAMAVEALTDDIYFTITTGAARKNIVLADIALTSGRCLYTTTNGRVSNNTNYLFNTSTGGLTVGGTANSAKLNLGGNTTQSSAGLTGVGISYVAFNYTNSSTAISGTVAHTAVNTLGVATLIASNTGVVYTIASTLYVEPPTAGTNITITTPYAAYFNGSLFSTKIGVNTAAVTTSLMAIAASTTSLSQINLATGPAPTSPVDGDIWREDNTNTGFKIRVNGVTKTLTLS